MIFARLLFFTMFLLGAWGSAGAQEASAETWQDIEHITGDLTGDKLAEWVVLRKQISAQNIQSNAGLGEEVLDSNPRQLLIVSADHSTPKLLASSENLIPPAANPEIPCLVDPLDDGGITIDDGVLTVRLSYWFSCGSYRRTSREYKFRFENGGFRLIGFDRLEFSRSSGLGRKVSINFLTGNRIRTSNVVIIGPHEGDPQADPSQRENDRIRLAPVFLEDIDLRNCEDGEHSPLWC